MYMWQQKKKRNRGDCMLWPMRCGSFDLTAMVPIHALFSLICSSITWNKACNLNVNRISIFIFHIASLRSIRSDAYLTFKWVSIKVLVNWAITD